MKSCRFIVALFVLIVMNSQASLSALSKVDTSDIVVSYYYTRIYTPPPYTQESRGVLDEFRAVVKERMEQNEFMLFAMQEPEIKAVMRQLLEAEDFDALAGPMSMYLALNNAVLEKSSSLTMQLMFIVAISFLAFMILTIAYIHRKSQVERIKKEVGERKLAYELTVRAQEEERSRIYKDLHDSVMQDIRCSLQLLKGMDANSRPPEGSVILQLQEMQRNSLASIRTIVGNMMPPLLQGVPFADVLRDWCAFASRTYGASVPCVVEADVASLLDGLSEVKKLNVFRIMQEAVGNAHRHSHSDEISVLVRKDALCEGCINLIVTDDGVGFDGSKMGELEAGRGHLGLRGMKARAEASGGTLKVLTAEGAGTEVFASIPL